MCLSADPSSDVVTRRVSAETQAVCEMEGVLARGWSTLPCANVMMRFIDPQSQMESLHFVTSTRSGDVEQRAG